MGDGDRSLLTVACRFTTLDQWLTTHVDPLWKVKHIKVWLLAKCLGIPLASSVLDDSTKASGLGSRKRSASPIIFAPDPRRRPVSPIRFAKTKKGRGRTGGVENGDRVHETPASDDHGGAHHVDGSSPGYDEDDEDYLDDADEDEEPKPVEVEAASIPPFISDLDLVPAVQADVNLTSHPAWTKYNADASSYTLIRFTTGQILEDEYSLVWYELSPYELLEMHAHLPVQSLPPSFTKTPGSVSHSSNPSTSSSHLKHRRAASLYSLPASDSYNTQPTSSIVPLHKVRSMAPLSRQSVSAYVQPYWEGYVRALRVVYQEDTEGLANFANGYGYGYGGPQFVKAFDPSRPVIKGQIGSHPGFKRVLEWSLKWVVIKDGTLNLCKAPEDTSPSHTLPLNSLTALRNNEQLLSSSYFTEQRDSTKPPFLRQPYARPPKAKACRKDKDRGKHRDKGGDKDGGKSSDLPELPFGSPKSSKLRLDPRSHISNVSMSVSSTLSRESTASESDDDDTGQEHANIPDGWLGKRRASLLPKEFSFGVAGGSMAMDGGMLQHSNASGMSGSWSVRSVTSGHSHHSHSQSGARQHLVGGEPVDDLKIVCVRYRSSDRLRGQMGNLGHKDVGGDVDGHGREESAVGKEKEVGRYDANRKEKGKGKGRKLLHLVKDDKDKDKSKKLKAKQKDKEKGKERDWISALAGGSKGKDKNKEKGKDEWATSTITIPSLQNLTNAAAARPVPSQAGHNRLESSQGDSQPASTLPSPTVLSYRQGDSPPLSSPGGAIRFANLGRPVDYESSEEEAGEPEDDGDDGEYDTIPNAKGDDGLTDLNPTGNSSASSQAGDTSIMQTQMHVPSDANLDEDELSASPRKPNNPSISSHMHPHEELQVLDHDMSSDIGSSPKFAHSEDTDEEDPETLDARLKRGYRYGYEYESIEAARWGQPFGDPGSEMLHEEEDRLQKEKINLERRRRKELAKKKAEEREKEKHDWLVLDMGTDLSFQSFLRILHRHLIPPVLSSFVNIPNYTTAQPSRSPTPTLAPYSSPISPRAPIPNLHPFQWSENPEDDEDFQAQELKSSGDIHPSSPTFVPSASTDSLSSPRSAGSTTSHDDRFQFDMSSQHPPALAALSSHPPATADSLGVLPYPEWRREVTERAQRAGMGEIGRGLKWVLWQDQHQLDLDLHAVRNQEVDPDEDSSAELKRLRRETLSLKNRRRSTASATPTIIGARSNKSDKSNGDSGSSRKYSSSLPPTVYDSDASEEIGKLIDDSDGESSELEWIGWTADLHRQYRTQEQHKQEEKPDTESHRESNQLYPPRNIEEDRLTLLTERRAYEPTGTVTSAPANSTTSAMTTPAATLYTASSSESLRRRRARAKSFSPGERSSSPTHTPAPQHSRHGHSHSQTTSLLANTQHPAGRQLAPGALLSHSTSMYGSGLRSLSAAALHAQRRPSMPTLIDVAAANAASRPPISRSPGAAQTVFGTNKHVSVPYSPSSTSFHTGEASSLRARDPVTSGQGSQTVTKRASFLGKDKNKGKERIEPPIPESLNDGARTPRPQRPKLSLSTSASQYLSMSTANETGVSSQAISGRSALRHAKSSSSFAGAVTAEEDQASSSREQRPRRKKKGTFAHGIEKFTKKLDSAIDFVDGGW